MRTHAKTNPGSPESSEHGSASDEQLACQAGAGCASSFEELCRRYQVPLLEFFRLRHHAADSEDLCQETLLRAYKHVDRYDSRWRWKTWLFVIARRISINHHQRFRITPDSEVINAVAAAIEQPVQVAAENENRKRLWDLARQVLTEEELTAIWLHYVEDMPTRQIARVLGRSWVSTKTMMFRARGKLRPQLRQAEDGDASGDASELSKRSLE